VISIANLDDLFSYLSNEAAGADLGAHKESVAAYRTRYGV